MVKNSSIIFIGYYKFFVCGGVVINSCLLCSCSVWLVLCVVVECWLVVDCEDDGWWEMWLGFIIIVVWYLVFVLLNCVG